MILNIRSSLLCGLLSFIQRGVVINISAQSLYIIKDKQAMLLNEFVSSYQECPIQPIDSNSIKSNSSYYTRSFTHPFNQIGMHSSYKWTNEHVWYASMSFLPYSLNGHLFPGTGIEIDAHRLFKRRAVYGLLQEPIDYNSANTIQTAVFQRKGYSIKPGYVADSVFAFSYGDKLNFEF